MTIAGFFVLAAVLLFAAALREWAESRRKAPARSSSGHTRDAGVPRWMNTIPALGRRASSDRLARAGAEELLGVGGLVLCRVAAASTGAMAGLATAAFLPGRGALLAVTGGASLGLIGPDLLLERRAGRRRGRIVARLAEAIDVLAVGVAGGQSVRALLAGIAAVDEGPLASELAITVAELEAGTPAASALAALRRRVPAAEIAQLTLAIERSARLGSPLAAELDRQATALRDAQRREIAERAARASPKIQLVIALVLVPSVLLLIAAALAANSDRFFAAF